VALPPHPPVWVQEVLKDVVRKRAVHAPCTRFVLQSSHNTRGQHRSAHLGLQTASGGAPAGLLRAHLLDVWAQSAAVVIALRIPATCPLSRVQPRAGGVVMGEGLQGRRIVEKQHSTSTSGEAESSTLCWNHGGLLAHAQVCNCGRST
jgi:hypothetical protein